VDLTRIRKTASDFGWPAALQSVAQGALNRAVYVRVLKCVEITDVDPKYLTVDPRFEHRFLDADELQSFTGDPKFDLTPSFLEEALGKGDRCYGILEGDRLASFGWYSDKPTKILDDLEFQFDPRRVYMYKGYTDPDYRGQRLHAIGMSWALKLLRERGYDGLISYVEATNFDSLRSCYRMGYKDVGKIYFARAAGRYWIHTDASCRTYGVSLAPV
jgi:ribosomal protein S18 acetylase RimI-like enzyme